MQLTTLATAAIIICGVVVLLASKVHAAKLEKDLPAQSDKASPQQVNEPTMPAGNVASALKRIVVVGGGLAGTSAALRASSVVQSEASAVGNVEIVLVDKVPGLKGGNSAKASSGINALNPEGGDSEPLFIKDTITSGGGRPELVETLVHNSPGAMERLAALGVNLSKVTLLGGHSVPRSRTNPAGANVGWTIMSTALAAVRKQPETIKIMDGYKLEEILTRQGAVSGVRLSPVAPAAGGASGGGDVVVDAQAVILATGGFAANPALLQEVQPAAAGLATTNGPWATGDALSVAQQAGARLIDMEQVQIHPTGFVDPKDPASGTKFLAPEKLRGVGAVLLNADGKRFVDELSTRDVVSAAIARQPGSRVQLLLSEPSAREYGQQAIDFYCAKGLMTKVANCSELAGVMHVEESSLREELVAYNRALASGGDAFGKTVFPSALHPDATMFVATVVPVVHYTMGGVEIDNRARALDSAGRPIPGLYAAGEVSGGLHGRNRLGGNSLLECAVFGSIAGEDAVKYALQQ